MIELKQLAVRCPNARLLPAGDVHCEIEAMPNPISLGACTMGCSRRKDFLPAEDRQEVEASWREYLKSLPKGSAIVPPLNQQQIDAHISEIRSRVVGRVLRWFGDFLDRYGLNPSPALGRAMWKHRHLFDLEEHTPEEREADFKQWESWIDLMKHCGGCGEGWPKIKLFWPAPPFDAGPEVWFARGVDWHNAVNRKRGIPETSAGAARRIWTGQPRKVIVSVLMAPGDTVMCTALVRDLKLSHLDMLVDLHGCASEIFTESNRFITPLKADDPEAETVKVVWNGESCGKHWTENAIDIAERQLRLKIKRTSDHGHLVLSRDQAAHPFKGKPYWVLVAGGKESCTVKIPDPMKIQAVIDATPDIKWVRIGQANGPGGGDTHIHPPLAGRNLVDLVGKTDWRQVMQLIGCAEGVLCPITAVAHIAAALGVPSVVIAGGRESAKWFASKSMTYLSAVGTLDCCKNGGCWKDMTVPLSGATDINRLCALPVRYPNRAVPKCIDDISVEKIVAAIRATASAC